MPFALPVPGPRLLLQGGCALLAGSAALGGQPAAPASLEVPEAPARAIARELCAAPRLAGTSGSLVGARCAARHLEAAGWQVELDLREVLLTYPRHQVLELFEGPASARPALEWVRTFDPDALPPGDVPLYNAWSASGDVRAPVVDVGHGLREDYEALAAARIDVRGALALARYGGSYRGIKVELAEEHGCAGLLLFSDDDGADQGEVWPFGPWKPGREAQRGSISPMARAPGDPSTPGWASPAPAAHPGAPRSGSRGARRLDAAEIDAHLPGIPCLPIGAEHAAWLLAGLAGPDGSGGRGPGPVEARLALDQPRELRTIVNVIARLPGRGPELVVAGSHRDAWVRGAHDSGSGVVALIRAAQHLGERARAGWRARHTLVIGLWDAEEFGLIGSTEWAEAHARELEQCLAYVNADAAVSGLRFGASGTPGLLGPLRRALERLPAPVSGIETLEAHPSGGGSLWEQWGADGEPRLGLPGSGSDFAVFLHHLSIPVLDVGLRGNSGGQYHTGFDDFPMVERYLDPGFAAHELAGEVLAELLAELADSERAGFDAGEAARAMAALVRAAGDETGPEDQPGGAPWLGPGRAESLARAFDDLALAAARAPGAGGVEPAPERGFYRALEAGEGLDGRAWFKNRLWAPGLETGYRAETLPSLRRAARLGAAELEAELAALVAAVDGLAADLNQARRR